MTISYLPLEQWRKNWRVSGNRIVCRHCRTALEVTNAKRPFAHAQNCKCRDSTPEFPLQELQRIRDELDQSGLRRRAT
ncbi:hypothetical protein [Pseudomonas sp. dw_358]|uniref:hypothetical protein n=1 Tax=Pseudomonas sp. dw_358 TaxID=2720083 RepID=UPI001BD3CC19|nr:hypothetical protein [Pseudomonas sp. dw_358]